jgi:hypothetical protein
MNGLNPLGQPDRYRSDTRRRASDQLLRDLVKVATGAPVDTERVRVSVRVDGLDHARDLVYAAAWFHDNAGRWLAGTHHDPARLIHFVEMRIENVEEDGFEVVLTSRGQEHD